MLLFIILTVLTWIDFKNGVLDLDEATVAFQNLGIPSEVGQKRWQNAMVKEFGSAKTQLNFQVTQSTACD